MIRCIIISVIEVFLIIGNTSVKNEVKVPQSYEEETTSTTKEEKETKEAKVLVKVVDNDYVSAYAEALVRGFYCPPSKEANEIMQKYHSMIEEEPRIVVASQKVHLMWTNKNREVILDGCDTGINVSQCIWRGSYPIMPATLEKLKRHYKKNVYARYGIAETTYLEDFMDRLRNKGVKNDGGLWKVRFYNLENTIVPVYSLKKDGELYIGEKKAIEVLK